MVPSGFRSPKTPMGYGRSNGAGLGRGLPIQGRRAGEELETGKPVFLEENECARRWGSNARRWVCCGGGGRGVEVVRALKHGSI